MRKLEASLLANELIGKKTRVYRTGDMLTQDFIEDRLNIELSNDGVIVSMWMG